MSTEIIIGDCRERLALLPDKSVHVVVTSPPYLGLRDYGTGTWIGGDPACDHRISTGSQGATGQRADRRHTQNVVAKGSCGRCGAIRTDSQIGLEDSPFAYVAAMVDVAREIWRVLRDDGTLWLVVGDSYASRAGATDKGRRGRSGNLANGGINGAAIPVQRAKPMGNIKDKELIGIPWRLAFALQDDGWYLRQDDIWSKPNPMPESVRDRCTKAHEYIFMLTKMPTYYFDADAIAEPAIYGPESGKFEAPKGYFAGARPGGGKSRRDKYVEGAFRAIRPTRNKRSVWTVPSAGFDIEMCEACGTIYEKADHRRLRRETIKSGEETEKRVYCRCGRHDAWLSHFATFPPALIEPCILASTSAAGCCSACGAPHERIVERKAMKINRSGKTHGKGQTRAAGKVVEPATSKTVGWRPSCECAAGVIPAMVLDPFGGAGTTALVADRLQRNATIIELNPNYAALARYRIDHERGPLLDTMEAAE